MNAAGEAVTRLEPWLWSQRRGSSRLGRARRSLRRSPRPDRLHDGRQLAAGRARLPWRRDRRMGRLGWRRTSVSRTPSRPPGGSFGTPDFLSPAGYNADTPQVAFDASGNALAVWRFDGSPASTIQGDYRPAGGEFAAPQTASAPSSQPAQAPRWPSTLRATVSSPGSSPMAANCASTRACAHRAAQARSRAPARSTRAARKPMNRRIAGDGLSGTIVSWKTFNGATNTTQAAVRPAGGSFGPPQPCPRRARRKARPRWASTHKATAIAVWSRSNGPNYLLEAAGYDARRTAATRAYASLAGPRRPAVAVLRGATGRVEPRPV